MFNEGLPYMKYLNNQGNFIFRISELYTQASIDMIKYLQEQFEKIIIYKPLVSNQFYASKYVICKNLKQYNPLPMIPKEQYI